MSSPGRHTQRQSQFVNHGDVLHSASGERLSPSMPRTNSRVSNDAIHDHDLHSITSLMRTSLLLAGLRTRNRRMTSLLGIQFRVLIPFSHCSRAFGKHRQPKQVGKRPVRWQVKAKRSLDVGNEDLRAQINTLLYEIESFKQEREYTNLRHEKELRDAQSKADADFKRAQVSHRSFTCLEELTREW